MSALRKWLAAAGGVSGDVLAVAGVLALVYGWYAGWDRYLVELLPDPAVTVRPVCERVVAGGVELTYNNSDPVEAEILGLHIKTKEDVSDLRFSVTGIDYAYSWGVASDAFSPEEANEFLSKLPKGNLRSKRIVKDMPRLMANTETFVQAYGVSSADFDCRTSWFNASSESKSVMLLDHPTHYPIRNMTKTLEGPSFSSVAFWILTLPVTIYALYLREQRRKRQPS